MRYSALIQMPPLHIDTTSFSIREIEIVMFTTATHPRAHTQLTNNDKWPLSLAFTHSGTLFCRIGCHLRTVCFCHFHRRFMRLISVVRWLRPSVNLHYMCLCSIVCVYARIFAAFIILHGQAARMTIFASTTPAALDTLAQWICVIRIIYNKMISFALCLVCVYVINNTTDTKTHRHRHTHQARTHHQPPTQLTSPAMHIEMLKLSLSIYISLYGKVSFI